METIIITLDNNKKKEYVKGIKLKEIIEKRMPNTQDTMIDRKRFSTAFTACGIVSLYLRNNSSRKAFHRLFGFAGILFTILS